MILAKQRVIDISKSIALPLTEREEMYRAYRRLKSLKKKTKVLKQREGILNNNIYIKLLIIF